MPRETFEMEAMPGSLQRPLGSSLSVEALVGEDEHGDIALSLDKIIDSADPGFVRRAALPLALGNAADAVEILSAGYIMGVFRDEAGNTLTSTQKELLTAAVFFGMLIGGVVAGIAADRLGRRYCLLISLSITLAFGALSAAAPSIGWLIVARVVAGVGVGGSIPVVFTLGAELFPTRMRGIMMSLIARQASLLGLFTMHATGIVVVFVSRGPPLAESHFATVCKLILNHPIAGILWIFWMVGSIFAATAAWVLLGDGFSGKRIVPEGTWRHYALVAVFPAGLALVLTMFVVPESPRFLSKAGRYEEMSKALQQITNGPVHLPPEASIKFRSSDRRGSDDATHGSLWRGNGGRYDSVGSQDEIGGDPSKGHGDSRSSGPGALRSLCHGRDKGLRQSTLVLVVVWFTLSYGTYGVSTWNNTLFADIGLSNPYLCSFIFSVASFPGNVASLLLVERVGRRLLLSISMALAAVSASLFAFGTGFGAGVIVVGAALFNAFSTCGWNSLDVVSTEVFPTVARASGMGLVAASGRMGSITAQFVNGSLEDSVLLLLMVTSGLTLIGGVASLLLARDTRGASLEEEFPHCSDNGDIL